jgi:hypothetical protein
MEALYQPAADAKDAAGALFKAKDYDAAAAQYAGALALTRTLSGADSDDDDISVAAAAQVSPAAAALCDLQLKCHLNLALCHTKLERWAEAEAAASEALVLEPASAKGLFRRGKARSALKQLSGAKLDLMAAIKLEPKNREVHAELTAVQAALDARKGALREGFKKGGGLGGLYSEEEARLRKGRKEREKITAGHPGKSGKDANDYSRFEALVDSDDEDAEEEARRKAAEEARKADDKRRREFEAAKAKPPAPPAPAKPSAASKTAKAKAKAKAVSSSSSGNNGSVVIEDGEEDLGGVRGYKVRADGSKTTFFNNDLTDEAKALIGDIAPKKIVGAAAVASGGGGGGGGAAAVGAPAAAGGAAVAVAASQGGKSAWNSAGTWEEKDVSEWATGALRAQLLGARVELGGAAGAALAAALGQEGAAVEGGALVVDDVKSLEGDANLATIRGRLRRFYDFSFKVQWSAKVGGRKYSGEIAYQDCSTDGDDWDEEAEARWKVPTKPSAEQRAALEPLFKHTARRSKSGLRAAIKAAVRAFEAEFDCR